MFTHLNGSDALLAPPAEGEPPETAVLRRVLGRLGDYAALIIGPLNMRPAGASLLSCTARRVEVRVSTPGSHIVLAFAPDADLSAEVFWLRAVAGARIPAPRLIAHDLSCAVAPCAYAIEGYLSGTTLDRLADGALTRVAARQIGRALRRIHQIAAPGFGRPTAAGRWPTRTWHATLTAWLDQDGLLTRAQTTLGDDLFALVRAATLDHPALAWERPSVVHGAVAPARALVSIGDGVQLEALIRPGAIVGGDPLFDLACGLLPCHPAPFRQGLLEGYTASGLLAPEQEERLQRLGLLLRVADVLRAGDAEAITQLLDELQTPG